jgi:anti-sigma-K factor RskA
MNYQQPELPPRLAAEYVLGTLQGKARLRFERLMVEQPSVRRLVLAWEQRLAPLSAQVKPQAVSPVVWQKIRQRIGFDPVVNAPLKLSFWQSWLWSGTVMASLLAGMLLWKYLIYQPDIVPIYQDVAVLSTDKAEPTWIGRANSDGSGLKLSSLQAVNIANDKDLELWAIADGAPESLGVIKVVNGQGELHFTQQQRQRLAQGKVLAISLEPKGGSPTGSPTGAVLFTGKIKV